MSDIFGGPPDGEDYDPYGYPDDYTEVEDPYGFFHGDEPEEWWYDDVSIYNDYGEEHVMSAQQWYDATVQDPELIRELYGMDNLDIIHELEDYGLWDSDDWETWREFYNQQ